MHLQVFLRKLALMIVLMMMISLVMVSSVLADHFKKDPVIVELSDFTNEEGWAVGTSTDRP